jgi:hypothetical protein
VQSDGTERLAARFVLRHDGEVLIVSSSAHGVRLAERDTARFQVGPAAWVTRVDGLRFLQQLHVEFRGSRYYATKVFEMDEDAAMTTPPLGYQQ